MPNRMAALCRTIQGNPRSAGELIDQVLVKRDEGTVARVKGEVRELVEEFPLYARVGVV